MPRDVTDFFEQYREAFNRLDGDAIADLYCVPSGIVSDRGLTAWQSREPIAENMIAPVLSGERVQARQLRAKSFHCTRH